MGLIATVGAGMSSLRKWLFPRMDTTVGTNLTGLFGIYFGKVFTALQADPRQNGQKLAPSRIETIFG
jgi:preprotein translocase subunit SecY